ncbi:MAG: hypothetical protein ACTHK0_08760, partial [Ginsengibacter sp.]
MNSPKEIPHNKLPVLQIVIGLMCIISVIFQSIISYIDRETKFLNYLKDIFITIIAETIFCLAVYYLIVLFDSLFAKSKWKWLRYPTGFIACFITCFYILYAIFLLQNHRYYPLHKMLDSGRFRMHLSINMMAVIFIYAIIIILNFYQLIVEKSSY